MYPLYGMQEWVADQLEAHGGPAIVVLYFVARDYRDPDPNSKRLAIYTDWRTLSGNNQLEHPERAQIAERELVRITQPNPSEEQVQAMEPPPPARLAPLIAPHLAAHRHARDQLRSAGLDWAVGAIQGRAPPPLLSTSALAEAPDTRRGQSLAVRDPPRHRQSPNLNQGEIVHALPTRPEQDEQSEQAQHTDAVTRVLDVVGRHVELVLMLTFGALVLIAVGMALAGRSDGTAPSAPVAAPPSRGSSAQPAPQARPAPAAPPAPQPTPTPPTAQPPTAPPAPAPKPESMPQPAPKPAPKQVTSHTVSAGDTPGRHRTALSGRLRADRRRERSGQPTRDPAGPAAAHPRTGVRHDRHRPW